MKSGFTLFRVWAASTGICSVLTLGASLGLIIFTVLIRKSEKQWKVLRDCLKNLPTGIPSGHQTFPRGCAPWESLMTLGNSLGQIFPDNPYGLSTVCPRVSCTLLTALSYLGSPVSLLRSRNSSWILVTWGQGLVQGASEDSGLDYPWT